MDVDFDRRLRNSKTVPGKKVEKKYTTTKNTAASNYLGSISKKTSNLSYQIPVARKSQFRNKRSSDANLSSIKKQPNKSGTEIPSPSKAFSNELQKSATKPGAYAQTLLQANHKQARLRT